MMDVGLGRVPKFEGPRVRPALDFGATNSPPMLLHNWVAARCITFSAAA